MHDPDLELEQIFQEAFAFTRPAEDTIWERFQSALPERQGWLSFHIAMEETKKQVQRAMTWIHKAVP